MLSKLGRPATEVSACQNTASSSPIPSRRTVPDPAFWAWSRADGLPAPSPESPFLSWDAEVFLAM